MIPEAAEVRLSPEDRAVLEARLRAPTTEQRDVLRARIVLLAAEGRSTRSIARTVGTMPRTVSLWRGQFAREGLAGMIEKLRPGPAARYGAETGQRILAVPDKSPAAGFAHWTGPPIAAELNDVHEQQVWHFLRTQRIDLDGRKSWCESNDPEFVAKAADVVGLYIALPENAIVICVDEKPSIQERAQGCLKLPIGRTLTGHSHDYKRHGTSRLFAAFQVATGKVMTAHKNRRRRVEFLDFMNSIVDAYPDRLSTSSITSIPTSPRMTVGSSVAPTCGSTSRRRGRRGSTKWKSASPSSKENLCTVHPSTPSPSFASTSTPSSRPTMKTLNLRLDQNRGPPAVSANLIPGTRTGAGAAGLLRPDGVLPAVESPWRDATCCIRHISGQ
jgi:transposase